MSAITSTSTCSSTFSEPIDIWLMKEIAFLGLKNMDVERIVAHVRALQSENWCPHIEESLLRQKVAKIIAEFSTQLQGVDVETDIQLVQTAILLGFVDSSEPQDAEQLVRDLMAENWFPNVSGSVLRQKLHAISTMFGHCTVPTSAAKLQHRESVPVVNYAGSTQLLLSLLIPTAGLR
ncbi:hypothetical protein FB45DRAFT_1068636 [Roridomyces roridus]|uniref:Uncharacterized protein n=1 Tax=Roridomyces roridus TaxID=1738132 RepID=A0AAD7F9F0_9AGAR|nr:hypothetical protein FB45DRAFT_1068636 [Roridomyces roridus]